MSSRGREAADGIRASCGPPSWPGVTATVWSFQDHQGSVALTPTERGAWAGRRWTQALLVPSGREGKAQVRAVEHLDVGLSEIKAPVLGAGRLFQVGGGCRTSSHRTGACTQHCRELSYERGGSCSLP